MAYPRSYMGACCLLSWLTLMRLGGGAMTEVRSAVDGGGGVSSGGSYSNWSSGAQAGGVAAATGGSYQHWAGFISPATAPLPEIGLEQPAGTDLTDNSSTIPFGSVNVGASSAAKTFTITNSGSATLSGLAVTTNGANAAEFSVGALGATSLAPGATTTFAVTFSPAGTGAKVAAIHIASNDSDENPFDIALTGTGVNIPGSVNIETDERYVWSENTGWINLRPTHGGVIVVPNDGVNGYLTGTAWSENLGWLKMGDGTGPYANNSATDWGVNMDAAGNLSGYAWSENAGWINFDPTHGQVTIVTTPSQPDTGSFNGFAWAENFGWVHFRNSSPPYGARTTVFGYSFAGSLFSFK